MTKTTAKWGNMPKIEPQPTYTSTTTTYVTDRGYWLRKIAGDALVAMVAKVTLMDSSVKNLAGYAESCTAALLDAIEAHEKEAGNAADE